MELDEILSQLLPEVEEIAHTAIERFQKAIQEKGLVLTEELKRDFQYHIIRSATTLAVEIEFLGYGRFRDMAQLTYGSHIAPVDAMEFFVERIGLDKFAYVLGYKGQRVPTITNAARRIAWAIAIGRKKVPSVPRGYRGTWYNASKMDMINQAKAQLSWRYSELITPYLKEAWEKVD